MSTLPIIAIDGPAGVGKTTIAKSVAQNLKIPYLDTGAMFRCLALKLGENVHEKSDAEIETSCNEWTFSLRGSGASTILYCNDSPVRSEIRTEAVAMLASKLGTIPIIREILKESQRKLGAATPLVAEGRDMGTVVFPNARFKFFLDASAEIRATRRLLQMEQGGDSIDLVKLTEQIRQRDAQDRNRSIAPLRPATDAITIDTTNLDVHAVLGYILHYVSVGGGFNISAAKK